MVITGTDLPSTIDKVQFAGVLCENPVVTGTTQIACTLTHPAPAGDHLVKVRVAEGEIPNSGSAITIPLEVTSISPDTNLNNRGGEVVTISGSGFDQNFPAKNTVTFTTDGNSCEVLTVTESTITCETTRFTTITADPHPVLVVVDPNENAMRRRRLSTTNTDGNVLIGSSVSSSRGLVPDSVSPVLKTDITIEIDLAFSASMDKDKFTVKLYSNVGGTLTYLKDLYVISTDAAAKTVLVKFPGAESGLYRFVVSHTVTGRLDSDPLNLTVGSSVLTITPRQGSLEGGTLLTITGENFSNDALDNPVKVGDHYCYVVTSTPTEITCRISITAGTTQTAETVEVIVFLKTSEEAVCATGTDCNFAYQAA